MARLYATANTRSDISFYADFITFDTPEGEYEFDLMGETDYSEGLNFRFKGDFVPWRTPDKEESEDIEPMTNNEIWEKIKDSTEIRIALFPIGNSSVECPSEEEEMMKIVENEELSCCECIVELAVDGKWKSLEMNFIPEFPSFDVYPLQVKGEKEETFKFESIKA